MTLVKLKIQKLSNAVTTTNRDVFASSPADAGPSRTTPLSAILRTTPATTGRPIVSTAGMRDYPTPNPKTNSSTLAQQAPPEIPTARPAWTVKPADGWPLRHCNDPKWRVRFWAKESINYILDRAETSVIILVWSSQLFHSDFAKSQKEVMNSLTFILPANEEPKLYDPVTDTDPETNPHNELPMTFAVENLSTAARNALIEQEVYSIRQPYVTFTVLQMGQEIPEFITLLEGLSSFHDASFIEESIRDAINRSQPTRDLIRELAAENPAFEGLSPDELTDTIIGSVKVTIIPYKTKGNVDNWKLALYIISPTDDHRKWEFFRDQVQTVKFTVYQNGIATPCKFDSPCTGCGGMDHPRGLCPYSRISGWNGKPSAPEKRQLDDAAKPNKAPRYDHNDRYNYYNDAPTYDHREAAGPSNWRGRATRAQQHRGNHAGPSDYYNYYSHDQRIYRDQAQDGASRRGNSRGGHRGRGGHSKYPPRGRGGYIYYDEEY